MRGHGHAGGYRGVSTMRQRAVTQCLWHGGTPPCQLTERPGTSIKLKAVVWLALPLARSARGGVSDTTALLALGVSTRPQARRGPRAWQGRRTAFATDQTTRPWISRKW